MNTHCTICGKLGYPSEFVNVIVAHPYHKYVICWLDNICFDCELWYKTTVNKLFGLMDS